MKNYNNISLLIAVSIIGFFGGIAFVNNWLVLNKNYPEIGMFQIPFQADVWGTVSDWAMVLVTILTAIYLIKTFRIQQKQIKIQKREIKRNKRDVEFNRILDVVYRQLDYTTKLYAEFKEKINIKTRGKYYTDFTAITTILRTARIEELKYTIENQYLEAAEYVLSFLSDRLIIYNTIINNSNLPIETKIFITKLVIDNIDDSLYESIKDFQYIYRGFKNHLKDEFSYYKSTTTLINDIEFSLNVVLGIFLIEKYKDLELE